MESSACVVSLGSMPQLAEAKSISDDWTGLTGAATRRKLQNRLNQRARRKRKAQELQEAALPLTTDLPTHPENPNSNLAVVFRQQASGLRVPVRPITDAIARFNVFGHANTPFQPPIAVPPLYFPLPNDHLLTLIHFNILRATLTNTILLSLLPILPGECSEALLIRIPPVPSSIPPTLAPTMQQLTIPHEQWIDLWPSPQMRDNLIASRETVDHYELCSDILGGHFEGYEEGEEWGVVVWGESWDPFGWEISEGFARKWWSLVGGCEDLIAGTNRWRALRGEDPLVVEV